MRRNEITLHGRTHVPATAEELHGHCCERCSLRDEGLCEDSKENVHLLIKTTLLCERFGGQFFEEDGEELWEDLLLSTLFRTLYCNGKRIGEVWGLFFKPPTEVFLCTPNHQDWNFSYEQVKTLLRGDSVTRESDVYKLKGGAE